MRKLIFLPLNEVISQGFTTNKQDIQPVSVPKTNRLHLLCLFFIKNKGELASTSIVFIYDKILSFLRQPLSLNEEYTVVKVYYLEIAFPTFVDDVKRINYFLLFNIYKVKVENLFRHFIFKEIDHQDIWRFKTRHGLQYVRHVFFNADKWKEVVSLNLKCLSEITLHNELFWCYLRFQNLRLVLIASKEINSSLFPFPIPRLFPLRILAFNTSLSSVILVKILRESRWPAGNLSPRF